MCLFGCKSTPKRSPPAPGAGGAPTSAKASCPASPPTPGFCGEGGTQQYSDDAVEVTTGVELKNSGAATPYKDAIAIKVKCPTNPHVVQFVYREIIGADGKPKATSITTTGGTYDTTTDPNNPNWNTDSTAPNPNYESDGASSTEPGSLTIYDQPAVESSAPLNLAAGETSRATFKSFVICDGKVIREVDWTRSVTKGGTPSYTTAVKKADALPDWADAQLKKQGYNPAP